MKGWLKAALHASSVSVGAERRPARARAHEPTTAAAATAVSQVTLIVYGWTSVEPGTLAWVFPSLAAAMVAVRAMKNAVRWAIVAGRRADADVDVEQARAHGLVLAEAL
jgi:hypothetical protein